MWYNVDIHNKLYKVPKGPECSFYRTGKHCCHPGAGFCAGQMDFPHCRPLAWTLPHLRRHLVPSAVQIGVVCVGNWCRTDRAVHCQRNHASLPLVVGVGERERAQNITVCSLMGFFPERIDECTCFWLHKSQLATHWQPAHSRCQTSKGVNEGLPSPCWMMPCSCNARHSSRPRHRLSASPFWRSQSISWQPAKERWYATACSSLSCRMDFLSPMRLKKRTRGIRCVINTQNYFGKSAGRRNGSRSNKSTPAQSIQQLLLFIQPLSSHEDFHLSIEGKCAIILAETVQEFGVLQHWPLITD